MAAQPGLVGRRAESAQLRTALDAACAGTGSLVLVAGEAGAGKTRLVEDLAEGAPRARVLRGGCSHGAAAPYGPIVAALRSLLRDDPEALGGCGPLCGHLALLLPELGEPVATGDRSTLFEAIRQAFAHLSEAQPLLLALDDLQWSDDATLELLAALAEPVAGLTLLVVGLYRSDGLPRDHGLRRLRHELRRGGRLEEIVLEPLGLEETAEMLARRLGQAAAPSLARAVHDRTQGIPFYIEELATALSVSGALDSGRRGLELAQHGEVPLPDTVRDAVLIAASELSAQARAAAEVAAVAGEAFDLELVAGLCGEQGLAELSERGIVRELGEGRAAFRHALMQEALYADVPWLRRRALHRELASALEQRGARGTELARHWLGARDSGRARAALTTAAAEFEAAFAYRDAADAGRQALELWSEDDPPLERAQTLERYGRCTELAGDLSEAAKAWRELGGIRHGLGDGQATADAWRRLAAVHELRGERETAFAVRSDAAEAYLASDCPAEAAIEHLAMANHLRSTARHRAAAELAEQARAEAMRAARVDLQARAMGLAGMARAKHGDVEAGVEQVRAGLALALEHDLTPAAAELYQRLSLALYDGADYGRAEEALGTALELCRVSGDPGTEIACVSCMAYVLRDRGEWARSSEVCRDLIEAGSAVYVAEGVLGSIQAFQGRFASGRRLLRSCLAAATRLDHYSMTVDSLAGLTWLAAAEGADEEASRHAYALLDRFELSDDHHYAVWGLRFASGFLANAGDAAGAHACVEALSRVAADTGHADALAGLAHAVAERALADGDPDTAAEQLTRALELHAGIDMPFERVQIELRAGVALAAAGERDAALERLSDAYRAARKLGARPVAATAARAVADLGESVAARLGRRAAADAEGAGLSRRELEIVRLVAVGHTNREIAQELFLSPRTVDMHVRNVLRKLDCRSRVEAAHRAGELGLLA